MKLPIKLNRAGWRFLPRKYFVFDDPRPIAGDAAGLTRDEFSAAVSSLQFGITFKTTHPGLSAQSNRVLLDIYRGSKPVILDVGASDGSTSLDLINTLGENFSRYFITDLNLSSVCGSDRRGNVYFLDRSGACVLRASRRFIAYADVEHAPYVLARVAERLLAGHRRVSEWHDVLLVRPDVVRLADTDPRVTIRQYDMFELWRGPRPDVIKVSCLLNRRYFSDDQLRAALHTQCENLANDGRLLLVSEDLGLESFSLFRKTLQGMLLEYRYRDGAKAADLVHQASMSATTAP